MLSVQKHVGLNDDNYSNPLKSLSDTISFDSLDYAAIGRDAAIYGIVGGWGNDDEIFSEMSGQHGWDRRYFDEFEKMHKAFKSASAVLEAGQELPDKAALSSSLVKLRELIESAD